MRRENALSSVVLMLLFVVCSIQPTCSQAPSTREYNIEDGLPSSNVYFTFQDTKGFIWVCTEKGVAKFNGYEFLVITTKDGLPSNDVFGMIESEDGRLWLNTFNQIVYLENGVVNTIDFPEFEGKIVFHQIDPFGNHFITADNKLFIHHQDGRTTQVDSGFLARHGSYYLLASKAKEIGIAVSENKIDNHIYFNGKLYPTLDAYFKQRSFLGEFSRAPFGIFDFDENKLFFVESDMITILEDGTKTTIDVCEKFNKSAGIVGSRKMNDSLFFLRFDNSIAFYNKNFIKREKFEFLNEFKVNNLNFDSNNNLWISTRHGLYFLGAAANFSKTLTFGDQELNGVSSICKSNEKLWVGNEKGELFCYENSKIKEYSIPAISDSKIRGIFSKNGILHLGARKLVTIDETTELSKYLLDTDSKILTTHQDFRLEQLNQKMVEISAVKNINTSYDGSFQVAFSAGVFSIDSLYNLKNLSNKRSYAVVKDSSGFFWIGQKDGLELFMEDSLFNYRLKNPYFSKGINDLAVDNFNYKWIATDGFGVICFKDSFVVNIPELENIIVNKIHVSDQNNIFIGTNEGMEYLIIENYDPFQYEYKRISIAHGLPSNEVTDIATDEKNVFVATTHGVTILDKSTLETKQEHPILYFDKIIVNDVSLPVKIKYELSHLEKNIKVEFVCLSYKSNMAVAYHYKMDGIDDHWIETNNRFKEYTTLPPGTYTFRLKAKDIDGLVTDEQSITFVINPPFWNTGWFYLIAFLTILLIVIAFLHWRTIVIKRRIGAKNLIHQQIAQSELKALQAQMNPHFVFNALNAIQDYIFQKDPFTASQYLAKFSKLMRLFLESSRKRFISLADELQLLNLYIELEQLRFRDKFKFEIRIGKGIVPSELEIPSIVLQPFVENAINHGLAYGKANGMLTISFSIKDDLLNCIIQDDGIGREKSKALHHENIGIYKSRGMQIVEERRAMLNYLENLEINMETFDLVNNNNVALGTKVVIELPLPDDYKLKKNDQY